MKIETEAATESFQPVKVTFTLETQGELNALGSLFNTIDILLALNDVSGSDVWIQGCVYKLFKQAGAEIHSTGRFSL